MTLPAQKKAQRRTAILTFFLMLWIAVLGARLFQLQVLEHPRLRTRVIKQTQVREPVYPRRGTIYDRTGDILARCLPAQSVFYSPAEDEPLPVQFEKIKTLKSVLSLSDEQVEKIKHRIDNNISFTWIKRKIDPHEEKLLQQLSLSGVHFLEENKRVYPHGKLAAHLLGRVNIDNDGISGVEYRHNSVLAGKKGTQLILQDAKKREYRIEILKEPEDGKDIVLTIDPTIQYCAEKELEKAARELGASWGTVIIARPSTGEILAMANYPSWDLNHPPADPTLIDRNRAIHHNFDPGSTFKIVSACAALETQKVNLYDSFDCSSGLISVGGRPIRDHQRFGILSFSEVIIHSSNVGTVQFARNIDEEAFYRTIKAFGFGQKTGIDLPAEEKGSLRAPDDWSKRSQAALSIGYEISVTPVQILQAISAIANDGILTPLRVVRKILGVEAGPPELIPSRRVISSRTASTLTSILQKAVEEGTGVSARVKGYSVAGKTGTAQKFEPSKGGYSSDVHIASFAGFVPSHAPALSMVVVIAEPKKIYYGGEVAAPVFREISSQVLHYLRIPPRKDYLRTIIAENRWRANGR